MNSKIINVPVLIIGGGPVGCALALDLNFMGTESLVVEQDAGTALVVQAKAGSFNERTIEFCRRWGLVETIANSFPADLARDTIYCTALTGHVIGRTVVPSARDRGIPPISPEMYRRLGQHKFDPILANAVRDSKHANLRYNMRFEDLVQDADGVTTTLVNTTSGEKQLVRSKYLVGCDGARSLVRAQLGIEFELIQQMDFSLSAMVRFDDHSELSKYGSYERIMFMDEKGTWANMTAVDGEGLWRFTVVGSEEALNPNTYDIHPVIRRALGSADVKYEVLRMAPWRRAQMLAKSYNKGRVVLAGDAVHTTSPTGGHGVNTGIGDSTNVSWMLSALVEGWGGKELLGAYTTERRPVAIRNFGNSTENYRAWVGAGMDNILKDGPAGDAARKNIGNALAVALHQEWFSQGIGLGYRYENSPIIAPDGTTGTVDHPSFYVPTARPGHRAPHAWLADGRSILDLFGKGFTLLNFDADSVSAEPFVQAAQRVGMPIQVVKIDQPEIAALYQRCMVLVRPDGHVAWRGDCVPTEVQDVLDTVRGAGSRQLATH